MAQLIKLEDYISRYEWNIYRYPSQFIRMKQDHWKKLHDMWLNGEILHEAVQEEPPVSVFSRWKSFLTPGRSKMEPVPQDENYVPETETDLKHYFLDKLFPQQLKWASSTVTDVSFMAENYYENDRLKYYLQRFPDTYLLMYYPIFTIKKAPVDGEIILISPIGIDIIYMVEKTPGAVITAEGKRSWLIKERKERTEGESKMLSPILALKRTEQIVKSVLNQENIEFPIKKVVLSRTNDIVSHAEPYNTKLIGKHDYKDWLTEKRKLHSPLKNLQLKAAEGLLKNCQITAVKRPEWEDDDDHTFTDSGGS
ncbi:NERD domain-containing protein [Lentibacillus salicampi]|uniref:NERD domain-containing protein n=1 Tax=Lentibacillus salicampi TaxID=175306 RepID=A0A4Y9ADX0_9BACI|nr:NERD domain-containing protein [Lentibacillus salicampi]TFJ92594.1 NERD domain-containing protein [Lentibacillus salicampi]